MVHNSQSWRIEDLHSEEHLSEIFPFSKRANSLIARNKKHKLLENNFLSVAGAVDMMFGMDYHHDNFMQIVKELADGENGHRGNLEHEVVAYINRIGQFYYFVKSELVKDIITDGDKIIPKINELVIFRHKHTAHRSIDYKQGENRHLQGVHARSLTGRMGILFTAKDKDTGLPQPVINGDNDFEKLKRKHWSQGYAGYQINMGVKGSYNIFLERDHPIIIREAYKVLEMLLN